MKKTRNTVNHNVMTATLKNVMVVFFLLRFCSLDVLSELDATQSTPTEYWILLQNKTLKLKVSGAVMYYLELAILTTQIQIHIISSVSGVRERLRILTLMGVADSILTPLLKWNVVEYEHIEGFTFQAIPCKTNLQRWLGKTRVNHIFFKYTCYK